MGNSISSLLEFVERNPQIPRNSNFLKIAEKLAKSMNLDLDKTLVKCDHNWYYINLYNQSGDNIRAYIADDKREYIKDDISGHIVYMLSVLINTFEHGYVSQRCIELDDLSYTDEILDVLDIFKMRSF